MARLVVAKPYPDFVCDGVVRMLRYLISVYEPDRPVHLIFDEREDIPFFGWEDSHFEIILPAHPETEGYWEEMLVHEFAHLVTHEVYGEEAMWDDCRHFREVERAVFVEAIAWFVENGFEIPGCQNDTRGL